MSVRHPFAVLAIVASVSMLAACKKDADAANGATASTAAGPAVPAPASGWVEQVAATPEGGIRMGNPAAQAKLIEYASYTCPHCAAFATESSEGIRQMVSTGRLSYEFRPFVRDPFDLTAALLARCSGPGPFFKLTEQVFASQQEWIGNIQNMTPADQQKIQALPTQRQFPALAMAAGLNRFFGQRGIPEAKARQCLADQSAQQKLVDVNKQAEAQYQITGTPTFLLNGEVIGSFDWAGLRPKLTAAIGG